MNEDSQERVIHVGRLLRNTSQQIFIVEDPCLFLFIDLLITCDKFMASCSAVRLLLGSSLSFPARFNLLQWTSRLNS